MANLKLVREQQSSNDGFTYGRLYVNGKYFCETIEDEERTKKIFGETAIPKGTYKVILTVSTRFKELLPLLLNVPNFKGIRIHKGNTVKDTEGCILLGTTRGTLKGNKAVLTSKVKVDALIAILKQDAENEIKIV